MIVFPCWNFTGNLSLLENMFCFFPGLIAEVNHSPGLPIDPSAKPRQSVGCRPAKPKAKSKASRRSIWLWVKTNGIPFWGSGALPILEPILVVGLGCSLGLTGSLTPHLFFADRCWGSFLGEPGGFTKSSSEPFRNPAFGEFPR